MTMHKGTRVLVRDGEHHGRRGVVTDVAMTSEASSLRVRPVVTFEDGTSAEIGGRSLEVIRA